MKRNFLKISMLLILIVGSLGTTEAHPSWGLVVDSKGVVYFVDVLHHNGTLWKYNPQSKILKALVQGDFHAHTLQIDENDILFIGVQLWKEGEIMGDGHNYLFRYNTKNDKLDTLIFSTSYKRYFGGNVVYNQAKGEVYFPHEKKLHVHHMCTNKSKVLMDHTFQRFSSFTYDKNRSLWIADSYAQKGSLYKWTEKDGLKLYANHLVSETPENPPFSEKNHWLIYGITFSKIGNPIICISGERRLCEILPNGDTNLIYQSPENFFPTGVFNKNSRLYIMEVGFIKGKGHVGPSILIQNGNEFIHHNLKY